MLPNLKSHLKNLVYIKRIKKSSLIFGICLLINILTLYIKKIDADYKDLRSITNIE